MVLIIFHKSNYCFSSIKHAQVYLRPFKDLALSALYSKKQRIFISLYMLHKIYSFSFLANFLSFILNFPLAHNQVHSTLFSSNISSLFNSSECVFISHNQTSITSLSIFHLLMSVVSLLHSCLLILSSSFNVACSSNHHYIFNY